MSKLYREVTLSTAHAVCAQTSLPVAVLERPDGSYRCEMNDENGNIPVFGGETVRHFVYPAKDGCSAIVRFVGTTPEMAAHRFGTKPATFDELA